MVQVEAREGLDQNKLVQAMLSNVKPPLFFRQYQTEDLSAWNGLSTAPAFQRLCTAVRSRLDDRGLTTPKDIRPRLFTIPNLRRFALHWLARPLVPLVLATLGVGTIALTSPVGRAAVCDGYPLPVVCNQPYSDEPLTPALADVVRQVREITIEAEQTAQRAREAEDQGRAAAAAASASQPGTKTQETDFYVYAGHWTSDSATGYGHLRWKAASVGIGEEYFGQFRDFVRVMGVYIYPPIASNTGNVSRYEGEWASSPRMSKGNWNGRAVVRYRDGSTYSGQVADGERHGFGTLLRKGGERVEGVWQKDQLVSGKSVSWKANGQLLRAGERAA